MPKEAAFKPPVPIETFEVMVTHECYRSIYNPWRQVLEYLACEAPICSVWARKAISPVRSHAQKFVSH